MLKVIRPCTDITRWHMKKRWFGLNIIISETISSRPLLVIHQGIALSCCLIFYFSWGNLENISILVRRKKYKYCHLCTFNIYLKKNDFTGDVLTWDQGWSGCLKHVHMKWCWRSMVSLSSCISRLRSPAASAAIRAVFSSPDLCNISGQLTLECYRHQRPHKQTWGWLFVVQVFSVLQHFLLLGLLVLWPSSVLHGIRWCNPSSTWS